MKARFVIDGSAPPWGHDLVRQLERAFAGALAAPQAGPFTYKSDIIDRMSDDQVATFETSLDETTPRLRQTWYAIQAVYHRSEGYPFFYGMMVDKFGVAETDRILKASGNA